MKHWITLFVTLCVLNLSGCAYTVAIKKGAERVRVTILYPSGECQYLGNVKECFSGGRWEDGSGIESARNKVINEAHAMGANVVRIGGYKHGFLYSDVCANGVAYKCDEASYADLQVGSDAYNSGDYARTLKEWKSLAEQGDADAQTTVGAIYLNGDGVPQDYAECYAWSSISATSGDEDAKKNRDVCADKLSPEALSKAQEKAAEYWEEYGSKLRLTCYPTWVVARAQRYRMLPSDLHRECGRKFSLSSG